MKYFFIFLFLTITIQSNAQTGGKPKLPLPEGVFAKDGKLMIQPGYTATFTKDKKSVEVRNTATNKISGEFVCACSILGPDGLCGLENVEPNVLVCRSIGCGYCLMTVVVVGITYLVDLGTGTMQQM